MSALSRFGPSAARSVLLQHQTRHMASAVSASDPIQKIFVDKIKEFKSTNKGLDAAHQRAMNDEMLRLKRVYNVEDESKLAKLDFKFPEEHSVSLHDLDESKELRRQIHEGEYQRKLMADPPEKSALMASIPEQVTHDLHLPPFNKPNEIILLSEQGVPKPASLSPPRPDYEFIGDKMTPARLERDLNVRFGPDMPTIHDDKAPERDAANFPRQPINLDTPPARFHCIPESWFQFFYPKTGVTGPYVFGTTFLTFLLSKEWLIWEHELLTGVTSTAIFVTAVIKFGPKITAYFRKEIDKEDKDWDNWQHGHIEMLNTLQDHYRNEMKKSDVIDELYKIRHQDVETQLEGEYRNRLKSIYDDVKRRLNYLVAVADSQRQISHKNMVNWVISNAVASIGQKQEAEVLDSCILNLKQLANKNAKAI